MKKTALMALLAASVFASSAAVADGWRLFAMSEQGFKFEPTVALTANRIDPKAAGADNATAVGVDLNFNCGLIQDPRNRMRTHLIVTQTDEEMSEQTGIELSPRYTVPMGGGLAIGVGPSLGSFSYKLKHMSGHEVKESFFGYGLAAGVDYKAGAFYAGADLRYHVSSEKNGMDIDHTVAGVKVGINF